MDGRHTKTCAQAKHLMRCLFPLHRRHVEAGHGGQACLLFEGNEPGSDKKLTYQDVLTEVSRLANWLKKAGVKKGDAVSIYMPQVGALFS